MRGTVPLLLPTPFAVGQAEAGAGPHPLCPGVEQPAAPRHSPSQATGPRRSDAWPQGVQSLAPGPWGSLSRDSVSLWPSDTCVQGRAEAGSWPVQDEVGPPPHH